MARSKQASASLSHLDKTKKNGKKLPNGASKGSAETSRPSTRQQLKNSKLISKDQLQNIAIGINPQIRFQGRAIAAIQHAAGVSITELMADIAECADHRRTVTAAKKDFVVASKIRDGKR